MPEPEKKPKLDTAPVEPPTPRVAPNPATEAMKASPPGGNALAGLSAMDAVAKATPATNWPWPVNGYVENNWDKPVTVWSDAKGLFQIPPKSTSSRFGEDVDHVQDGSGQWWKIGAGNVTVDAKGNVSGAKCKTSTYGKDCGK